METSDDEEQQEITNLALMAIGKESFDELDEVNYLSTYDELHDAFKELHDEWMKIGKKNACLKKKMVKLTNENESLTAKIACLELDNKILHNRIESSKGKQSILYEHEKSHVDKLIKENEMLKKMSNELNEIVLKFTNGQKNLEKLLSTQKCVFDKGGLGYKPKLKQKYYKNYFVKVTSASDHKIVCHYCNINGHMNYRCHVKRNAYY